MSNPLWKLIRILYSILPLINVIKSLPIGFEDGKYLQRINLITGERYVKDLTQIMEPDAVPRLRLLIGTAKAMSSDAFVDIFRLRLRWLEPDSWNDNWINITQRSYDVICEIEDEITHEVYRFVDMRVDSTLTGYDENFLARNERPLLLQCSIRAVNSANLTSKWRESPTAKLNKLKHINALKKKSSRDINDKLRTLFLFN